MNDAFEAWANPLYESVGRTPALQRLEYQDASRAQDLAASRSATPLTLTSSLDRTLLRSLQAADGQPPQTGFDFQNTLAKDFRSGFHVAVSQSSSFASEVTAVDPATGELRYIPARTDQLEAKVAYDVFAQRREADKEHVTESSLEARHLAVVNEQAERRKAAYHALVDLYASACKHELAARAVSFAADDVAAASRRVHARLAAETIYLSAVDEEIELELRAEAAAAAAEDARLAAESLVQTGAGRALDAPHPPACAPDLARSLREARQHAQASGRAAKAPAVLAAEAALRASEAQLQSARADGLPSLGPFAQSTLVNSPDIAPRELYTVGLGVQLTWAIQPERLGSSQKSALLTVKAAAKGLDEAREAAGVELAAADKLVGQAERSAQILQRRIANLDLLAQQIAAQSRAGLGEDAAVRQARLGGVDARAALLDLWSQLTKAAYDGRLRDEAVTR